MNAGLLPGVEMLPMPKTVIQAASRNMSKMRKLDILMFENLSDDLFETKLQRSCELHLLIHYSKIVLLHRRTGITLKTEKRHRATEAL